MASILQAAGLSKSYGVRTLFENLYMNINEGDKIALIAPNGSGKSTLLRILAGKDSSDGDGSVKLMQGAKVAWLEQDPELDPDKTIFQEVFRASEILSSVIVEYEAAIAANDHKRVENAVHDMDIHNAWQYEQKINQVLSRLNLPNSQRQISTLSGGRGRELLWLQL